MVHNSRYRNETPTITHATNDSEIECSSVVDLPSEFFLEIAVSVTESSLWLAFSGLWLLAPPALHQRMNSGVQNHTSISGVHRKGLLSSQENYSSLAFTWMLVFFGFLDDSKNTSISWHISSSFKPTERTKAIIIMYQKD